MKRSYLLILFVIVVLSIVLRFYRLGVNPPSLDWDEASIGYNAYSILKTGADEYGNKLPVSFRSFDDYKPPLYIYLTVPAVYIFGLTEYAVRFPAAVIGVIAVIAVYFFTLEILRKWDERRRHWTALCASLFLAVSPWHLQFSRAAFEGNIGICFLILSILFFLKGLKKRWFHILFAVFLILSTYSYHSFRLINPFILIILCILFYKEIWRQKIIFGCVLIGICLISLPVYNSVFNQQGTGARLSMVTVFSDPKLNRVSAEQVLKAKKEGNFINALIYNRRFIFIPKIISGYFDHFNFDFLFLHGDGGVQHHAYNMGMLYLWDFPFILIGIIYLLKKRNKRIILLFLLFLLAPLPSAITSGTPHPVRAIAMIPAFQIFTAVGIISFLIYFNDKKLGKIIISAAVILFFINILYYLNSYYIETPVHYGYFWQYGNKQAIQFAAENEKKYDHIIMTYAYDQPYIYYLFYNKIDPVWYQHNWNYSGDGTVARFYRKIGRYEFMNISGKQFSMKKTLLIGTPSEIPPGTGELKKEIIFPDGRLAYRIVAIGNVFK